MPERETVEGATPRQVLYGMVAAGFVLVVAVLTGGAAAAGLVPAWWTWTLAVATVLAAAFTAASWRRTGRVLGVTIGLFVAWTVGTLMLA
jgi:hypothetical protein